MVHPINDEYSNRSPYHMRSAAFVQTKGLAANEKSAQLPTRIGSPATTPPVGTDAAADAAPAVRKMLGPTIPLSLMRSRTPESSGASRSRTNLSTVAGSSDAGGSQVDIRSLTAPPLVRAQSNPPAQGNIKKKRMSLNGLEQLPGGTGPAAIYLEPEPPTPITPAEPPRNNYGDPNKIAQFFPELKLSQ